MKGIVSYTALLSIILVSMSLLVGCGKSIGIGDIVENPSK